MLNLFENIEKKERVISFEDNQSSINIEFINKTPLLQIDVSDDSGTTTRTKRIYKNIEGSNYPIAVPVFSANAMRGLLRRISLEVIVNIGKEVDENYIPNLKAKTLNFHSSGDDKTVLSMNNLTYKQEVKLRELMPNISLFGAGLSFIEGKTAISELAPLDEQLIYEDKEGNIKQNNLIRSITSVRFDETLRNSNLSVLVDSEDVEKWIELVDDNNKIKKEKKALEEKAKKGTLNADEEKRLLEIKDSKDNKTQMLSTKEYVVPNTIFKGSISSKRGMEFTDVEIGLLYACLIELSQRQLGSCKKEGFGVGNYLISSENGNIQSTCNEDYYLGKKEIVRTENIDKYLQIFTDFIIENKTWEYLDVEVLLSKLGD